MLLHLRDVSPPPRFPGLRRTPTALSYSVPPSPAKCLLGAPYVPPPGEDPPRPSLFLKSLSRESLRCALSRESRMQPPPPSPSPARKLLPDAAARGRGRRMRGRGSQRPPRSRRAERKASLARIRHLPPARPRLLLAASFPLGVELLRARSSACAGFLRPFWGPENQALAPDTAGPHRPPAGARARRRASSLEPGAGRGLHFRPHPLRASPPASPTPGYVTHPLPAACPPPPIFRSVLGLFSLAGSDTALKELHRGNPRRGDTLCLEKRPSVWTSGYTLTFSRAWDRFD